MLSNDVFHYTKATTALEFILADKRIKLGQFQFTNDPKESKELYFNSFTGMIPEKSIAHIQNNMHQLAKKIKLMEWKVLCFSQHQQDLITGKLSLDQNPFLSGKYLPSMWAHYGGTMNGQHNGVCFKFNKDKLITQIQSVFGDKDKYFFTCEQVEYDDQKLFDLIPLSLDKIFELNDFEIENRIREYFLKNFKEIFFRKSNDWENEHEFRCIVYSKLNSPEFLPIDGILEEVLVGPDFPQVYEPSLIKLCENIKVPAKRLHWINGIPEERPIK